MSYLLSLTLAIVLLGSNHSNAESSQPEVNKNPFEDFYFEDFEDADIPHLKLSIKSKNFNKLLKKRDHALQQNALTTTSEDYVTASIKLDKKKTKVKIRLKGDYVEHLKGGKWSFRVKVKGKNTLLGMKVFSLQHPHMRLFLHEWVVLKALRHENLIALRYHFVKLSINGKYLGIFNLEEHFEKRLVENNQRREGPIFKLDEQALFDLINQNIYSGAKHDDNLFLAAEILPFQKKKTAENDTQKALFDKAAVLLDAFRDGRAKASEVFNIEQFAKYYAVSDVFMGKHGNRWHNQRFYFNPVDSRIEPIGFDFNDDKAGLDTLKRMNRGHGLFYGTNWAFDIFSRMLFSDPEFFTAYIKHANRITQLEYLNNFFESVASDANRASTILKHEFNNNEYKKYINFDRNFKQSYYDNQRYVKNAINAHSKLKVHLKKSTKDSISIVYNNRSEHLLEVFEYRIDGKTYPINKPQLIHSYRFYNPHMKSSNNLVSAYIPLAVDPEGKDISFRYRTLGGNKTWATGLITDQGAPSAPRQYKFPSIAKLGHPTRTKSNWTEFTFLKQSGGKIVSMSGKWTLNKTLILPANSRVQLVAGTEIDFKNSASIISRSPLDSLGTKKHPVKLYSSDQSGGGVFVYNAEHLSTWNFTYTNNLSHPSYQEWNPTGSVTFFKSPLHASNCKFIGNSSEDALNTINTDVILNKNSFRDIASDAFDADFCKGTLTNNKFENIGNDAVDVSGSKINIETLYISNAGDKGVSAGENSIVNINNLDINTAKLGVASKDSSLLFINQLKIQNTKIAICAYQKKPEYDLPQIHIKNLDLLNNDLPILFEDKSILTIDGKAVKNPLGKKQNLILDALRNGKQLN